MNAASFLRKHEKDVGDLRRGISPAGVTTCGHCSVPLQEAITGNRVIKSSETGFGVHVCSDCYFDALSAHLDNNPIAAFRPGRRG